MAPKVSVIIPTYNHRDYVLQTLDSVRSQTFRDFEIIVINDGSPDDTAQVLQPLATGGHIRYIEQPNAGQASARNRGLREARGEFIAFLDDDDWWPTEKLEWQVAFLNEHPDVAVVGGSVQYVDGEGASLGEYFHDQPITFDSLFRGCPFISPGQTLIRAADLKRIGGLNEELWGVDDFDLWFRLLKTETIVTQPRPSLFYRQHATNASNDVSKMFSNILKVVHAQLAQAPAARRAQLSRVAYRWLYSSIGNPALGSLRVHKLTPLPLAKRNLKTLSCFAWPALRDGRLLGKIARDATPNALKLKKHS